MKRIKSPPDKGNQWGVLPSQKHQSSFSSVLSASARKILQSMPRDRISKGRPRYQGCTWARMGIWHGKVGLQGPRCESGVRDAAKSQKMTNREKSSSKWMIYICPTHKIPQRGRLHMKRFQDRPARAAVYPGRASFDRNVPVRQQRIVGEMI